MARGENRAAGLNLDENIDLVFVFGFFHRRLYALRDPHLEARFAYRGPTKWLTPS
jgi:hypothetical protein